MRLDRVGAYASGESQTNRDHVVGRVHKLDEFGSGARSLRRVVRSRKPRRPARSRSRSRIRHHRLCPCAVCPDLGGQFGREYLQHEHLELISNILRIALDGLEIRGDR